MTDNKAIKTKPIPEELKKKTVLITGATGLIGSSLMRNLLDGDVKVVAMTRSRSRLESYQRSYTENDLKVVDGNPAEEIKTDIGHVDYIVHTAGPVAGSALKSSPVDVIRAHAGGTGKCLDYLQNQGDGRLIVLSSATVYGDASKSDTVVSEDQAGNFSVSSAGEYALSKIMSEKLAQAYYKQFDTDHCIARLSYVYGPINPGSEGAFPEFVRSCIRGEDITIQNPKMRKRDYIYIDDVIDGLLMIMAKGRTGEAYNVSSGGEGDQFIPLTGIAKKLSQITNRLIPDRLINVKDYGREDLPGVIMDNSKIKKLGWKVRTDLDKGLEIILKRAMEETDRK